MACELTSGRTHPCKEIQGGITKIWIADFAEAALTVASGVVTAIGASITEVYPYELRSNTNNNLVQNVVTSKDNASNVNTQTIQARLPKMGPASVAELNIVSKANPIVFVQDRAGNVHACGISEGMDCNNNAQTGNAREDFNGYELTFTSQEGDLAPILDAATTTALLALESATTVTP